MEITQRQITDTAVTIDYTNRQLITADGTKLKISPTNLAFYGWLARRRKNNKPSIRIPADGSPEPGYAQEFLAEYHLAGSSPTTIQSLKQAGGMTKAFFTQRKSNVRNLLKDLGPLAKAYDIQKQKGGRLLEFFLGIEPSCITFIG